MRSLGRTTQHERGSDSLRLVRRIPARGCHRGISLAIRSRWRRADADCWPVPYGVERRWSRPASAGTESRSQSTERAPGSPPGIAAIGPGAGLRRAKRAQSESRKDPALTRPRQESATGASSPRDFQGLQRRPDDCRIRTGQFDVFVFVTDGKRISLSQSIGCRIGADFDVQNLATPGYRKL